MNQGERSDPGGGTERVKVKATRTTRKRATGTGWDGAPDLRALAESIPGLVFVTDAGGTGLFVNGRFQAYTGLPPEGLLGRAWLQAVHPGDRDRVATAWDAAVAAGEPFEIEMRLRSAEGDHVRHLARATPVREGDRVVRWVGHCAELEDRGRGEAEERLRLALGAVDGIVYDLDLTTGQAAIGGRVEEVTGYRPEEVPSRFDWWTALIHPEDLPRLVEASRVAAGVRQQRVEAEYRIRHRDGHWVELADRTMLLHGPDGPVRAVGSTVDISARKAAEAALRESEARLSALVSAMGLVWSTDAPGETMFVGDWARYTGLPPEDARGRGWARAIHPDDRAGALAAWNAAVAAGSGYETRYRLRRHDGQWRWQQVRGVPVAGPDGKAAAWVGVCIDIHDEVEARAALQASEQRLRLVLEGARLATWDFDIATGDVELDARWLEMRGHEPGGFVPRFEAVEAAIHPEDRARVREAATAHLEGRTPFYAAEYRSRTRDGGWIWVAGRGQVYERDAEGRPLRMAGVEADITEPKQAEAALRESEERFRSLWEQLPLLGHIFDPEGNTVAVNPAFERALGVPAEAMRGYNVLADPQPRENGTRELLERTFAGEVTRTPPIRHDAAVLRGEGKAPWIEVTGFPIRDAEGRVEEVVLLSQDITARVEAEQALRESEELNRRILAASPDCIKILSLDARLEFFSDGGLCAMEVEDFDRQIRGADWFSFWRPEDRPLVRAAIDAALAGGTGRFQGFCPTAKGTPRWWDVSVAAILGADGAPERLLSVSRDVTAARDAEDRLREGETRLRLATDAAGMFGWEIDLWAGTVAWADNAARVIGCAPEELPGDMAGALFFVDLADRPRIERAIEDSFAARAPTFAWEFAGLGDEMWRAEGLIAYDSDGTPLRVYGVTRDITERRRAEERVALLADAAARLLVARDPSTLIHEIFALIAGPLRLDAYFNYHLSETGGLELAAHAGIAPEAALAGARLEMGQAVCGLVARDRRPVHVEDVQASDDPLHAFIKAQGLTAYACTPLLVGDRLLGTLGFGRRAGLRFEEDELTFLRTICHYVAMALERLRAEAELLRLNAGLEARVAERTASLEGTARALQAEMARREAAQAELLQTQKMEALGQVVGGVAHDFNNILAAIQGSFEILDRRLEDPRLRQAVEQGQRAAERAAALIRQMLAFARREPIAPRIVDPARILDGIEGMVRHSVGGRVECRFAAEPGTWPVLVDPHQLEVALLNLAVNARDAMPGGGTLTVRARNLRPDEARPEGLAPGDHVLLTVADTGSGMDEATRARALEPFFTTKEAGHGTGLGLAQVQGFVAGAGGAIAVESAPGRGTTIAIHLPRSAIDGAEAGEEPAPAPGLHGGASLLLVNGDEAVRGVMAASLRALGYAVTEAADARVAAALARIHPVDLLVTEAGRPDLDGPALARALREERPDLPVLHVADDPNAAEGGAVLARPFTEAELALHVLQALGRIGPGSARRLAADPRTDERLRERLATPELRAAHDR